MIVFVHNFMKNVSIFFKFTQGLYLYILCPIPVMLCCNKVWVHFEKSKCQRSNEWEFDKVQKVIVFVHNFMKNISIFFKFTLELYFYVLYPISVMVCCKKVWVHFEKWKVPAVQRTKIGAVKKIIVFVHNFMKNILIFFKFTQALYLYILCLIPVMVCCK